jgi:hypothetical protein
MQTLRQSGRTAKQMLDAPEGAIFIWCNANLLYPIKLAQCLDRPDLIIRGPHALNTKSTFAGMPLTGFIVDHACELTQKQSEHWEFIMTCMRRSGALQMDGGRQYAKK